VSVIARVAEVGGDALAFAEHFHRARRKAHLKLVFGEAVGNAIIVVLDLHMIVEPGAPNPPLGVNVRLHGQRLERRAVEVFEELLAGDAQPISADGAR